MRRLKPISPKFELLNRLLPIRCLFILNIPCETFDVFLCDLFIFICTPFFSFYILPNCFSICISWKMLPGASRTLWFISLLSAYRTKANVRNSIVHNLYILNFEKTAFSFFFFSAMIIKTLKQLSKSFWRPVDIFSVTFSQLNLLR